MDMNNLVDTALLTMQLADVEATAREARQASEKAGRSDLVSRLQEIEQFCRDQSNLLQLAMEASD